MALEQIGNAITFYVFYSAGKVGKTGLTVTVNVRRGSTSVVTGGAASEVGDGLYSYTLASGSVSAEDLYTAVFKTGDTSVDQRDIPALWVIGKAGVENLDASLASIKAQTDLISVDNVSFTAPTDPITGDLTLVRGDDYTLDSGRPLPTWASDDWAAFSLSTALSVTFKARTPYSETIFAQAASVLSDTQVAVELTSAQTGAFAAGHDAYRFDLEAVLATGSVVTLAQGNITVIEDVR